MYRRGDRIYRRKGIGAWPVVVAVLVLFLFALLGCDNEQKSSEERRSLDELAREYWTARFIHKDYRASYAMELGKETLPFEEYVEQVRNMGQIAYKSIRTDKVTIENGKGLIDLTVTCRMPNGPVDVKLPLKDEWVLESNRWKHVLPKKKSKLPLPTPSSLMGR